MFHASRFTVHVSTEHLRLTNFQQSFVIVILLASYLCGCGSTVVQQGQVVYVAEGQALVDKGSDSGFDVGDRLLVYRQVKLTHPVSGEFLGVIREELAEVSVDAVRKDTSSFQIDETSSERSLSCSIEPGDRVTVKEHHDGRVADLVREVGSIVYIEPESQFVAVRLSDSSELGTGDILVIVAPVGEIVQPISPTLECGGSPIAMEMRKIAEISIRKLLNPRIKIVNLPGNSTVAGCEVIALNGTPEIGDVVLKVSNPKLSRWFLEIGKFSKRAIYERAYRQAIRYYGNAEYWQAIKKLKTVEVSKAGYEDTLYMLAACYKHLGLYNDAERYFQLAVDKNPDDPKIWLELAYMHLERNLLKKAAEAYEQLAKLQPDNPKIWMDLGDIFKRLGEVEKSEDAYQRAAKLTSDSGEIE